MLSYFISNFSIAFLVAAAISQAGGLGKRFSPFADGEVNQAEGAEAVHEAEAGDVINEAGGQQHQRHIDAPHGTRGVGQDGRRMERASNLALAKHQGPHGRDGDDLDDEPGQGRCRFMAGEKVVDGGRGQTNGQQKK